MRKQNRFYSILAVVALVVGALTAALIWGGDANRVLALAGASETSPPEGAEAVSPSAVQASGLQIYEPVNGAVITERPDSIVVVSGQAWDEVEPAPFPEAPVLQPVDNFGDDGDYTVEWTAVADAANYVLQESTQETFATTTDYLINAPDTSQFIFGNANGIYYYRVAAYNAAGRPSRWSNVETVTVTNASAGGQPILETSSEAFAWPELTAVAGITVEVSVDDGENWHLASLTQDPEESWVEWSYDWTLPEADGVVYPIRARALDAGGIYDEDAIAVTVKNSDFFVYMPIIFKRWPPIPVAPVMNDIPMLGSDDYRVSWTYNDGSASIPDPTEYELQEASNPYFTENLKSYTVYGTSKDFMNVPGGIYFYRVRGKNSYGYGPWSNTKSVSLGLEYNFTSSTEGWSIKRSDEPIDGGQLPEPVAANGYLYHMVIGSNDFSIISPMEAAPSPPYTIEGYVDIVDSETIAGRYYWAKNEQAYGIIFGGNGGYPCPADKYDSGGCLDHYYRLLVSFDASRNTFVWSLKRIDGHADNDGSAEGVTLINWHEQGGSYAARGWNKWRIEVSASGSDNIKIYFNDNHVGTATDTNYVNGPYFGAWLNSPNHGDIAVKWDWFKVR
ncbi:MAG: hypothetical protein ACP5HS_08645 [Anaerolineae bacterium]